MFILRKHFDSMTNVFLTTSCVEWGTACLTHWGRVTHICVSKKYHHCLAGAKPLSEPMLEYCQLDHKEHISVKFYFKFESFHSSKYTWKCRLWNGGHFVFASLCSHRPIPWLHVHFLICRNGTNHETHCRCLTFLRMDFTLHRIPLSTNDMKCTYITDF